MNPSPREYRIAPELRRSCWYVIVGTVVLIAAAYWVTGFLGRDRGPAGVFAARQRVACRVTATSHPALVLPAAFAADGLPLGLQLVGRHRDDLGLLRAGAAIEAATGLAERHPQL